MESFDELLVENSLDGSKEPSLFWLPPDGQPSALVVGLHTWSADRFNQAKPMLPFCQERGWALLLPEFRGPNLAANPRAREAGGSALARRDIVDATRHILATRFKENVPPVFLVGGSGGGHMSLMVAARESFQWSAVSSWCPITDLATWHGENPGYAAGIEAVCGGSPAESDAVCAEYLERSPIHYAEQLAKCRLLLAHGRFDKSVPFTHGWNLAQAIERHQPREHFFYLFDGGHEAHLDHAFRFFDQTVNQKKRDGLTG